MKHHFSDLPRCSAINRPYVALTV